jgi:hypothetical protein
MCKQWAVLFDSEGLDTLVPWGELAADRMMTKLSGGAMPSANPQHIVSRMMLRAQFNLQRFPEVWTYQTDEDIEYADMRSLWEDNPQYMADLIRVKGDQLFGDKPGTKRKQVIV